MTTSATIVTAAVVQAGAISFDAQACVDKACRLIGDAARAGAAVAVFPEAFIGGYPKGLNHGLVVGARDPAGREEFRLYLGRHRPRQVRLRRHWPLFTAGRVPADGERSADESGHSDR